MPRVAKSISKFVSAQHISLSPQAEQLMRDRFLDKYILNTASAIARTAGRSIVQANDIRLAMKRGSTIRMTKGYKSNIGAKIRSENKIVNKMRIGHGRRAKTKAVHAAKPTVPGLNLEKTKKPHLYTTALKRHYKRRPVIPRLNLTNVLKGTRLAVPRRVKGPGRAPGPHAAHIPVPHIAPVAPVAPLPPPPPPRMFMLSSATPMTTLTHGQRKYRAARTWTRQMRMAAANPEGWNERGMKDYK